MILFLYTLGLPLRFLQFVGKLYGAVGILIVTCVFWPKEVRNRLNSFPDFTCNGSLDLMTGFVICYSVITIFVVTL